MKEKRRYRLSIYACQKRACLGAFIEFTLRSAEAKDFIAIASWVPDAQACQRWAGPNLEFPFAAGSLPSLLGATPDNSFCLVDITTDVVGFGQISSRAPSTVHLARIIVAPDSRGLGIGHVPCDRLIEKARQSFGASAFTLRVYPDNAPAIAVYTRLGFVAVGTDQSSGIVLMEMKANNNWTLELVK
jgi:RimJ/RimL family protein N-acetyltransferase